MRSASKVLGALALALAPASPVHADFALNNLRHILFHEIGHAVIDQMEVAISGPEETAADGFAMVLADRLLDEGALRAQVSDVVRLARIEAEGEVFDPWHDYMPGAQRLAWAICVYYGLAPEARGDHARALGMPPWRAPACAEAGRRVRDAWAPTFETMRGAVGTAATFRSGARAKVLRLLAPDVEAVNRVIALPRPVPIGVEHCGEDNAFYYHDDERIAFCAELFPSLDAAR